MFWILQALRTLVFPLGAFKAAGKIVERQQKAKR